MNTIITALLLVLRNLMGTIAVTTDTGVYTLNEILEQAKKMSDNLRVRNTYKLRIGLVADNSIEWIIAWLAILMSNHKVIRLSPRLDKTKLTAAIQKGQIQVLITDKKEWYHMHDQKHWLSLYEVIPINAVWHYKDIPSDMLYEYDLEDHITTYSPRNLNKITIQHNNTLLTASKLEEKGLFANTSTYVAYASFADNPIVGLLCPLLKGVNIVIPTSLNPSRYNISADVSNYQPETIILTGLQFESFYKEFIWNSYEFLETTVERFELYWLKRRIIKKRLTKAFPNLKELVILNSSINAQIESTLKKVGFPYTITYGSCETEGITSYSNASSFKEGSVGRIVDKNISILNGTVMTHAGEYNIVGLVDDVGEIDEDDFFFFKHRIDDEIVTKFGFEMPSTAEKILKNLPFVNDCLIVSYEDKLLLIVYPDLDYLDHRNITMKGYERTIDLCIQQINNSSFSFQKIDEIKIVTEDFVRDSYGRIRKDLYNLKTLAESIKRLNNLFDL